MTNYTGPNYYPVYHGLVTTVSGESTTYASGDVHGGLLKLYSPWTTGMVTNLRLFDDQDANDFDIYIFKDQPSSIADDAAFAPTQDDLTKLLFNTSVTDYVTPGSAAGFAALDNLNYPYRLENSSFLWAYLVYTQTPANGYTAVDTLKLSYTLWAI